MREMISNPCKWNAGKSGSSTGYAMFLHEGGTTLYHFSPHDCGIPGYEHHMAENLVFFADSEEHASTILERMLKFRIKCHKATGESQSFGRPKDAQNILDHKHLWKFPEAPKDQFYVVGWADNDTIL